MRFPGKRGRTNHSSPKVVAKPPRQSSGAALAVCPRGCCREEAGGRQCPRAVSRAARLAARPEAQSPRGGDHWRVSEAFYELCDSPSCRSVIYGICDVLFRGCHPCCGSASSSVVWLIVRQRLQALLNPRVLQTILSCRLLREGAVQEPPAAISQRWQGFGKGQPHASMALGAGKVPLCCAHPAACASIAVVVVEVKPWPQGQPHGVGSGDGPIKRGLPGPQLLCGAVTGATAWVLALLLPPGRVWMGF